MQTYRKKLEKPGMLLAAVLAVLLFTACNKQPTALPFGVVTGIPTISPTPTLLPTPTPTPTLVPDPYNIDWWLKERIGNNTILSRTGVKLLNEEMFGLSEAGMHRPDRIGEMTGDELRTLIESASFPKKEYLNGKKIIEEDKEAIIKNRNLTMDDSDVIKARYAIATDYTAIRRFPTFSRLSNEKGTYDYFQETGVYIGEPLAVLWESEDGEWFYVQTLNYSGWIKNVYVGFCEKPFFDMYCKFYFEEQDSRNPMQMANYECDRNVIRKTQEVFAVEDILKSSPYYYNSDHRTNPNIKTVTRCLRAGTILFLLRNNSEWIYDHGYNPNARCSFYLPERNEQGKCVFNIYGIDNYEVFSTTDCFCSDRFVLTQANNLLGTDYSWGDESGTGYDCSSTIAAIYRTFGLFIPRNTGDQQKIPYGVKDISGLDTEAKKTYIMEQSAGTLLYFPGHVMMYIGECEGKLYVLHNTTDVTYEDGTKEDVMSCVITSLDCGNGEQTYLERLTTVLDFGAAAEELEVAADSWNTPDE